MVVAPHRGDHSLSDEIKFDEISSASSIVASVPWSGTLARFG